MTDTTPKTDRELYDERIAEVRAAMSKLQSCVELVAMEPKNVAKGGWATSTPDELFVHAVEELGEVANAIRKGADLYTLGKEIGDAAWCLAMLLDRLHHTKASCGATTTQSTSPTAFVGEMLAGLPPAELTFVGCHLPLRLLDASDLCPRCGKPASAHRNWGGR